MNQFLKDVRAFSAKMGHDVAVSEMSPSTRDTFALFRAECVREESAELLEAAFGSSPEEYVDALLDLVYFALGTCELMGVDTEEAWSRIHAANMAKEPGIKPGRLNPFGMPDAIKPDGWRAPVLSGTTGKVFR